MKIATCRVIHAEPLPSLQSFAGTCYCFHFADEKLKLREITCPESPM